jgi:hypothetical protein
MTLPWFIYSLLYRRTVCRRHATLRRPRYGMPGGRVCDACEDEKASRAVDRSAARMAAALAQVDRERRRRGYNE